MTGIEMLRDVCKALKGSPWCGTDVVTIGGEPACERLSKIADQIERETLPRPLFEDGKVARIGEVARYLGKNKTIADMYVYSSGYHKVIFCDNTYLMLRPSEMLERPEPPDTWKRVEADSKKFVCDYYGRKSMFDCREGKSDACPVSGTDDECEVRMAQDLVRRCKALAGVE